MHNQSFFLVQNQAFSPVCLGNVLVFDPGALRQLWSHESSTQWWLSPIPHGWIFSRFNFFSNNYRNLDHRHIPRVSEILHTLAINCSVNSSWQNGNTLINMSRCKGIRWVPETALGQSCLGVSSNLLFTFLQVSFPTYTDHILGSLDFLMSVFRRMTPRIWQWDLVGVEPRRTEIAICGGGVVLMSWRALWVY